MNRQKNFAILGGILFLIPYFLGGGFFHLITNWNDWSTQTIIVDNLATQFLLILGGGLVIYGLVNRKQK
ncbi:MAG: hypothetical protein Q8P06_00735 [Candidatus Azambacteria bacterium]|nr:hypothetical protein [Candidatus Azambacteria bacterium]